MSNIKHLIVICTENHSFDSYFGSYCEAPENSNPQCNNGPSCCEKPPETLQGQKPIKLDNAQNLKFDPIHEMNCEVCEINNGKMDRFISGCSCSNPQNFAFGDSDTLSIIHNYAISDRYFQAAAGARSMNNMYLARAQYVFTDNEKIAIGSIGLNCYYLNYRSPAFFVFYYDPTITHLLANCNFVLKSYAEGYDYAKNNFGNNPCEPFGYSSIDIP